MARNNIGYEGRLVDTERMPVQFGQSKNGNSVIKFTVAESHQTKNKNAATKYQKQDKSPEDYVDTTTTWHKVTAFGDQAERLALDENFGHGAVLEIRDAQYTEEDPWTTKDNVSRAGRPETLGDDSFCEVKVLADGRVLGPKDEHVGAHWDGDPESRKAIGGSGGSAPDLVIAPDEGF